MATNVADLRENLGLQLSEVEMLRSMYPEEDELKLDDEALIDIQEFCSGKTAEKPNGLNFSLSIYPDCESESHSAIDLSCYFPQDYPVVKPDFFARSQSLNRDVQKELNDDLSSYISTLDSGELCTLPAIQWIQENGDGYIVRSRTERSTSETENKSQYRKPGVVCLEGDEYNVEGYFSRLRRLNWKKITCRHREKGTANKSVNDQRKFTGFVELFFEVHGTRENHMDMGQFLHYLEEHDLGYIFQVLFGIEGKSNCDV
ncbi:RWD domain-containing protein 2A-like [Orbicella faveolata]|uniref:RWD domain-containing protein 2A-like n=1 Tax=Orbicella faveolata TaxID=48498 RepID=UPI0009E1BCDF|nr:RWD domain-containing protein 2A-like [Orbicella faveolata]